MPGTDRERKKKGVDGFTACGHHDGSGHTAANDAEAHSLVREAPCARGTPDVKGTHADVQDHGNQQHDAKDSRLLTQGREGGR